MLTQKPEDAGIEVKTHTKTTFSSGQYSIMDERIEDAEGSTIRTYLYVEGRKIELVYDELKQLANLLDEYLHIPR